MMGLLFELQNKNVKNTFKAPEKVVVPKNYVSIFLAGSIEMNKAKEWQKEFTETIHNTFSNMIVVNPRRDGWDSSWTQELSNKNFYEQVDWEHEHITTTDIVFIYFQKETKSPISLMELGLVADTDRKVIVLCEEGFWRKGNVDYICKTYPSITQVESFDEAIKEITKMNQVKKK